MTTLAHRKRVLAHLEKSEQLALAKKYRDAYWSGAWLHRPEEERIDRLFRACTAIMQGDRKAGERLAREAIWS